MAEEDLVGEVTSVEEADEAILEEEVASAVVVPVAHHP